MATLGNRNLSKTDRKAKIVQYVHEFEQFPLKRKELAAKFKVSESRIKHDIEELVAESRIKFVKSAGNAGSLYKVLLKVEARKAK